MPEVFKKLLEGDFIFLRKVEETDAQDIFEWRTSSSGKFLRQPDNYSVNLQIEWIKSRSDNEINYIIYSKSESKKVGMISIYDVNFADKVTDVGRLLLEESYLKKSNPYGMEALSLAYGYVFNSMLFRKITGVIAAKNAEMYKLQKFLGMHQEGYLKRHTIIGGVELDLYVMSIFRDEFPGYSNKIKLLLRGFKKG
jgi:diamine N-acetyltransferase